MTAKRIDIAEFRRLGYLQELNRLFLHPLGLALEVVQEEDGTERLGGIWDSRDDPEGIVYSEPPSAAKGQAVAAALKARWGPRHRKLDYFIQPLAGDA